MIMKIKNKNLVSFNDFEVPHNVMWYTTHCLQDKFEQYAVQGRLRYQKEFTSAAFHVGRRAEYSIEAVEL